MLALLLVCWYCEATVVSLLEKGRGISIDKGGFVARYTIVSSLSRLRSKLREKNSRSRPEGGGLVGTKKGT